MRSAHPQLVRNRMSPGSACASVFQQAPVINAEQFGIAARSRTARETSAGFTLVELLVTISIVALLLMLLLPALQTAREAGRRSHCQSNLKQIGLALLMYHEVHGTFPHGGWGHEWVGVPDLAEGENQPGGWAYCSLPFLELQLLHDQGLGSSGEAADQAFSSRIQTPIEVFVCPTRRSCSIWPIDDKFTYARKPKPYGSVTSVARADYAINAGGDNINSFPGPPTLATGLSDAYWKNVSSQRGLTGISHLRVGVSMRSIEDGASKTYLVGEKYIEASAYHDGTSLGDNENLYAGYGADLHRFVGAIERLKIGLPPCAPPLSDFESSHPNDIDGYLRFGSSHTTGLNMAFSDGAASFISFDIAPELHFRAGHRRDQGQVLR